MTSTATIRPASTLPSTTAAQEAGIAPDNGTTPEDMNPLMLFAMLFQALGQRINGETIQFAGSTTPSESLPSPTTPNIPETQRAVST